MKKALLLLATVLVSFSAMAAKIVPTKAEFPNYAGYITTTGSADYLYNQLIDGLDDDDDEVNISIMADRDTHTVKMTIREKEDDIDIKFVMTFTAEKDRIYYKLKMSISSEGEDITELMKEAGMAEYMDGIIDEMLKEIAQEL